jgi:hypothetical protein
MLKHYEQFASSWLYSHEKFDDEVFTETAQSWMRFFIEKLNPI